MRKEVTPEKNIFYIEICGLEMRMDEWWTRVCFSAHIANLHLSQ